MEFSSQGAYLLAVLLEHDIKPVLTRNMLKFKSIYILLFRFHLVNIFRK